MGGTVGEKEVLTSPTHAISRSNSWKLVSKVIKKERQRHIIQQTSAHTKT